MYDYVLRSGVHICTTAKHAIFLDITRDQYYGLDRVQASALSTILQSWPWRDAAQPHASPEICKSVTQELVEANLIVPARFGGKLPELVSIPSATIDFLDPRLVPEVRITASHVIYFAIACVYSYICLKGISLERSLLSLRHHRVRPQKGGTVSEPCLRSLVRIYRRLRPFFYPSRDHCLFDSFTLVKFLSFYGVHPTLVFGVRGAPFAAHSWVQHNTCVLNGSFIYSRRFVPILAVTIGSQS
jgi:Transglutaminase-like superfamily